MQRLKGKTAIVTGASQGIGRSVAQRFFAEGANLVLSKLPEHGNAEDIIENIEGTRERVIVVEGNLRDLRFVKRLFEEAERHFGAPDIIAAIAGVNKRTLIADATDEDYEQIFSVNAQATFWLFREAAKKIRDGGRIIGVSSNLVVQGRPGVALYAASKASVEQFVKILAKELGERNVTVNAIAPGPTDTAMVAQLMRDTAPAITPLGRLGRPSDIADVAAFLVSEDARWVTGQVIGVNGGIV
jgi:3-oxoacyl-[acyl-carrier protein] reductase